MNKKTSRDLFEIRFSTPGCSWVWSSDYPFRSEADGSPTGMSLAWQGWLSGVEAAEAQVADAR
jgi:hypothetical protein